MVIIKNKPPLNTAFFWYCVPACVWRCLWVCVWADCHIWALRLWAIYCTYIPKCLRCQCNHRRTNCNIRSKEWETYDSFFCESLRIFLYGLIKSPFLLEASSFVSEVHFLDKRERMRWNAMNYCLPLVGPNLHEPELFSVCLFFKRKKPLESPPSIYDVFLFSLVMWTPFTAKRWENSPGHDPARLAVC